MMQFTHCGFKCMTHISPMGVPCGYVGLPKSHPYFGKHRNDVEDIEVHGNLTFAGYWEDFHDNLWWLGFDCGHSWDVDMRCLMSSDYSAPFKSNKSDDFVEEQTKRLAEQLEKVK